MNIDRQVKRHGQRSGFRLADVAEVGLPAYKFNVEAVTMAHKRIAPIEEFLLRCIGMEVSSVTEMSSFLGIDEEVIVPALSNLAQTESIALTSVSGKQSWVLTTKGKSTLETAELVTPEGRTFQIQFDAILRRPGLFRSHQLLDYKELRRQNLIQIELYPPRRPTLNEISAADLERLLKTAPASRDKRRDILAIRSLDQRSIKKHYVAAVALLFRGIDSGETQLGFIVDGKLSSEHENAFSRSEGFSRAIRDIGERDPEEQKEIQAAAAAVALPKLIKSIQENVQSSTRNIEAKVAELTDNLGSAEDKERIALLQQLETAEKELARLKSEEKKFAVKFLYVTDHPPLLDDAITTAKHRIMIISPWISGAVVDSNFLNKLKNLLSNGVKVYIGYGISENETQKLKQSDAEARESIRKLVSIYPNLTYTRIGNTHAKVLIKDTEFAAITSFNWLSFKGDSNRKFRDEQGVLLRRPTLVEEKFAGQLAKFRDTSSK